MSHCEQGADGAWAEEAAADDAEGEGENIPPQSILPQNIPPEILDPSVSRRAFSLLKDRTFMTFMNGCGKVLKHKNPFSLSEFTDSERTIE